MHSRRAPARRSGRNRPSAIPPATVAENDTTARTLRTTIEEDRATNQRFLRKGALHGDLLHGRDGASRQRLERLVQGLSDEPLGLTTAYGWTVASLLAPLAFWDQRVLALLRSTPMRQTSLIRRCALPWLRAQPPSSALPRRLQWILNSSGVPPISSRPSRRPPTNSVSVAPFTAMIISTTSSTFFASTRAGRASPHHSGTWHPCRHVGLVFAELSCVRQRL